MGEHTLSNLHGISWCHPVWNHYPLMKPCRNHGIAHIYLVLYRTWSPISEKHQLQFVDMCHCSSMEGSLPTVAGSYEDWRSCMKAVPTCLGVTLMGAEVARHRRLLMPLMLSTMLGNICFDAVSMRSAISMIWFIWFVFWANYHCDFASCPCFFSVYLWVQKLSL